ncbi:uncharacterized protein LOC124170566 [Ischnura elegans]|uniref:uncharacterized protein LOC124170566 n=1 Tax=Ischnura elegans TaxID=197161 RepID=UPI001ED8949A|nr:uncharacterized protein LOC124170566 [Ischnura elegans]
METDLSEAASHGKNNIATLEARKKVLEAALQGKTEELRRLCVAEAELTGELPPETPVGPGEEPPLFRRRVHTAFTLPNNLIEKIPCTQDESLLGLELEYEIQSRITTAALHLANDCSAKKAVRRQRRLIHQQSQRRLMELEARLNLVQQNSSHKSQKPRKKPRPPLDAGFSNDNSPDPDSDPILQDDGVSLSPLGMPIESQASPSIHPNSSDTQWQLTGQEIGHVKQEMRSQSSLLLLLHSPHHMQQPRGGNRAHGQTSQPGDHFGGSLGHRVSHNLGYNYVENYPIGHAQHQYADGKNPLLNERASYGRGGSPHWNSTEPDQFMGKYHNNQNFHSLGKLKVEPSVNARQGNLGSRSFRRHRDRISSFGSLDRQKHVAYNGTCVESRSVDDLDALQGGLEGKPTHISNTFASSKEHSKNHLVQKPCNEEATDMEHGDFSSVKEEIPERIPKDTVKEAISQNAHQPSSKAIMASKGPIEALLPGQTYPEHSLGQLGTISNDRVLLRTQSLGSVETSNISTRGVGDVLELSQNSQHSLQDSSLKKLKEKEWYETSLDTPAQTQFPPQGSQPRVNWKSLNTLKSEVINNIKDRADLSPSAASSQGVDVPDGRCGSNVDSKNCLSPDVVFQQAKSGSEIEVFDTVVPFELPKNHMVIQAGKWQPYWEVTKPFEMSDFYKYSTKFRKSHSINLSSDAKAPRSPQPVIGSTPVVSASHHIAINRSNSAQASSSASSWESGSREHPSPTKPPQQKGIYMPLQPLTCHPLEPPQPATARRAPSASPVHPSQQWSRPHTANSLPLEVQAKGSGLHSKDGALSSEMIAWHQDQSVPHSATLV